MSDSICPPPSATSWSDQPATGRMPVLFVGHGSPMNVIEDNHWRQRWQALGSELLARAQPPRLILCISAHWLTPGWQLTAMDKPRTIHDFGGFPQALFDQQYPAPGSSAMARAISGAVRQPGSGRALGLDEDAWGLDHGSWSVLCHAFADADIPLLQLSIDSRQSPAWHFALGQQLAFLREQGVLIAGSGNIVHNLARIDWQDGPPQLPARQFADFARKALLARDWSALINYQTQGTAAQFAVPHPDHYLPLLYVIGASLQSEEITFSNDALTYGSLDMLSVRFG